MAPKADEANWFSDTDVYGGQPSVSTEPIAVRVSNFGQDMFQRHGSVAGEEVCSDGEEDSSFCCFPRGRSTNRKGSALSSNLMDMGGAGAPFARLDTEKLQGRPPRSRLVGASCCCCGPRRPQKFTVEVRAVDVKPKGVPKGKLRTQGRWEIDVNEEYFKPPIWKQLIRKVRAHAKQVHSSRCEWVNYDLQSYEKNFDNGGWRDSCTSAGNFDENDEVGTKERAMHTALLQKFASSRSQQCSNAGLMSPLPTPIPVRTMSKEDMDKNKEDFVPIWQRRAATPIKLDLRQRSGPQGE